MRKRNLQGRYCNCKTVLPPSEWLPVFREMFPEASLVWAKHVEEGHVTHYHLVGRFLGTTRWQRFADWLHDHDGHEYADNAGSWRRSVRYLLHLDNPEKPRVPRENLDSLNIDADELDTLLSAGKLPILESLILAQSLPLNQRFAFLVVERGHLPSEVSAAIRCMMDLEKWEHSRTCLAPSERALPSADPEFDFIDVADSSDVLSGVPEEFR